MFSWLKGFPIEHYIIMAAIGVAVWVYGDLTLTKQALEDEQALRERWQRVAETQQAIQQRDTIIVRASDEADRAIREAPNASTLVPPDVAATWAAGIDSVRDAGIKDAGQHDVPRSTSDPTKRRGVDSRSTSAVLKGPGRSVSTV